GAPISTTHVISSTILGVGSSKRFSAVRWGVAKSMVVAWVLTLPAAAVLSALFFFILKISGLA
ncbi:MAG: inorganic phosphate transporter, partial [Desulfobacteraceae bacterium]